MFTGGELDGGVCALDQSKAINIVRREHLLPPVNVQVFALLGQLDDVRDIQTHPAVDTQREIWAKSFTVALQVFVVLS